MSTKRTQYPRLLLFALLTSSVFYNPSVAGADAPDSSMEANDLGDVRAQGILYYKRKVFKQARAQLERAFKMPGGNIDPQTSFYLAKTYKQLKMIDKAFYYGELALDYAPGHPRVAEKIRLFMDDLSNQYGPVEFQSERQEGVIYLTSQSSFLNPTKRAVFESIKLRLRSTQTRFPTVIYLPFGRYIANNVTFTISGQSIDTAKVFISAENAQRALPQANTKNRTWWYVGASAVLAAAGMTTWYFLRDQGQEPAASNLYNIVILNGEE